MPEKQERGSTSRGAESMNIPVNIVTWGVAVLPIIILLVLMTVFHLGAMKAAPVGAAVTIISGYFIYKADMKVILSEGGKGVWNAFIILLIVWTAVLLYQVGNEVHAFRAIRNGMRSFLPNELLLVLALGWIFESFLQGITGFGVPVAVGAPLLIGIGVKPMWAVIIPLLGQSWGNTYGTLGAAWDALAMTSGLAAGSQEYIQTAGCAGILLWLWNFILGMQICWFYGKGSGIKKGLLATSVMSLIQGGGELLLSQVNTTIACFVPACISLLALIVLGKTHWYCEEWKLDESQIMERGAQEESQSDQKNMSLLYALFPYILLSAITLLVLVVKPLNEILGSVSIGFSFPETVTGYGYTNAAEPKYSPLSLFTHASMFLMVSSVIAMLIYKNAGYIKDGGISRIFKRSFSMAFPSSIAVLCLVVMSKIMSGTGQTIVLANGISSVLGNAYLLLTPFIGMLGSFMTGSNMSSNILFGNFQIMTAKLLSAKIPWMLGAQTAGGSIGSAISPSNIVLGTTTANILGQEGNVLKRTSLIVVPVAIVMGILILLFGK